ERIVAIKLIDASSAHDELTIDRFKKEAQALAKIRHANIVQVYGFGPHGGAWYFAMEHVAGRSLETMIDEASAKSTTIDLRTAMSVVRAIGGGLDAVHAQKLVHRDVKPGNVVIENETGRPVLIDFGLARRKSASSPKLSIAAGTPSYMAPEQAR